MHAIWWSVPCIISHRNQNQADCPRPSVTFQRDKTAGHTSFWQCARISLLVNEETPASDMQDRIQGAYNEAWMDAISVRRWVKHCTDGGHIQRQAASYWSPTNRRYWQKQRKNRLGHQRESMCNNSKWYGRGDCSTISVRSRSGHKSGVPGGWVPHSLRDKKHLREHKNKFLASAGTVRSRRQRFSASWLHQFIWKQNEYGMARNKSREQGPQSAGPRELSLAMLKHSNRSSFCHKETPSMPLVNSRHSTIFVMHRMINVRRRNRSCCNTTTQGTTLFVCRGTAFRPTAETSLPEGLGLASTDYHHTRDQQCATGEAGQEDVRRWLQTAEQTFYRLARWKKALTAILYWDSGQSAQIWLPSVVFIFICNVKRSDVQHTMSWGFLFPRRS